MLGSQQRDIKAKINTLINHFSTDCHKIEIDMSDTNDDFTLNEYNIHVEVVTWEDAVAIERDYDKNYEPPSKGAPYVGAYCRLVGVTSTLEGYSTQRGNLRWRTL
jgi:hypothetical protein